MLEIDPSCLLPGYRIQGRKRVHTHTRKAMKSRMPFSTDACTMLLGSSCLLAKKQPQCLDVPVMDPILSVL